MDANGGHFAVDCGRGEVDVVVGTPHFKWAVSHFIQRGVQFAILQTLFILLADISIGFVVPSGIGFVVFED